MSSFRFLVVAVVAVIAGWGLPAAAVAAGGSSIASGPTVTYGQQEFGNLATDHGESACGEPPGDPYAGDSWWSLSVLAGDKLTIDYEGAVGGFLVFPIGTNDFNVTSMTPFSSRIGGNDKQETSFTVTRTGSMPLDFAMSDGCPNLDPSSSSIYPGPYDFVATVRHAVVVSLSVTKVDRRHHHTSFAVGLHNPDGAAITNPSIRYDVQHRAGGVWRTTSTSGPPLVFSYKWTHGQRGKWQYIRVRVHGPDYLTTTSRTVRTKGV